MLFSVWALSTVYLQDGCGPGSFPWEYNVSLDGLTQAILSLGADVCMVSLGVLVFAAAVTRVQQVIWAELAVTELWPVLHVLYLPYMHSSAFCAVFSSVPLFLNQVSCVTKDACHFPTDDRPHVGGREVPLHQFLDGDSENQLGFLFLYWLFLLLFSDNPVGCLFLFLVFYLTDAFNFNVPCYFTCFMCPSKGLEDGLYNF